MAPPILATAPTPAQPSGKEPTCRPFRHDTKPPPHPGRASNRSADPELDRLVGHNTTGDRVDFTGVVVLMTASGFATVRPGRRRAVCRPGSVRCRIRVLQKKRLEHRPRSGAEQLSALGWEARYHRVSAMGCRLVGPVEPAQFSVMGGPRAMLWPRTKRRR